MVALRKLFTTILLTVASFAVGGAASKPSQLPILTQAQLVRAVQDCMASLEPTGLNTANLISRGYKRGEPQALLGAAPSASRLIEAYYNSDEAIIVTRSAGGPVIRDCMIPARLEAGNTFGKLVAALAKIGGEVLEAGSDRASWFSNNRVLNVRNYPLSGTLRILAFYKRPETK